MLHPETLYVNACPVTVSAINAFTVSKDINSHKKVKGY